VPSSELGRPRFEARIGQDAGASQAEEDGHCGQPSGR
jgi:hypothetical protein